MIACDRCNWWYHRDCVNAPTSTFQDSSVEWECVICVHSSSSSSSSVLKNRVSWPQLVKLRAACPVDNNFVKKELFELTRLCSVLARWGLQVKKVASVNDSEQMIKARHLLRQAHGFQIDMNPLKTELESLVITKNDKATNFKVTKQSSDNKCICRKKAAVVGDKNVPMICCDGCGTWYHMKCMRILVEEAEKMATYECPACMATAEDSE